MWGTAGRQLSMLKIDDPFLAATEPQTYKDAGIRDIGGLIDGKDIATDTPRKNTAATRAFWSDKVHNALLLLLPGTPLHTHLTAPPPPASSPFPPLPPTPHSCWHVRVVTGL